MSELIERVALLKRSPSFSRVTTDDLRVVATVLQEEACFAGERVFEINDKSDKVYFIRQGEIGISIGPDTRKREYVARLGPGDCFGEMGMFDDKPRSATAHVLQDGILLSLEKAKLRALLVGYPEVALAMLRTLSERLRDANLRLEAEKTAVSHDSGDKP